MESVRSPAVAAVLCASFVLAPIRWARAEDEERVTIHLKDGGVFRGELVEKVPGDHVTIKLATGEVKRFAWSDIEDGATSKPKVAPADRAAEPTEDGTPRVRVFLDADHPAITYLEADREVEGNYGVAHRFVPVCRAPCNEDVAPGRYRIGGRGLRPSNSFVLRDDAANIVAKNGTTGSLVAGWVLVGLGTSLAVTGVSLYVVSKDEPTFTLDQYGYPTIGSKSNPLRTVGAVMIGIGAAAAIVGFIVLATNGTTVSVNGDYVSRRAPPTFALTPHAKRGGFALTPTGFVF